MASVVREDKENLTSILTVNLAREDYEPDVKKELNSLKKKVSLKGFRKGMVPLSYLKKVYGNGILVEKINSRISKELFGYIDDNKVHILGQPLPIEGQEQNIDIKSLQDYSFKFELGLAPEIEIKGVDTTTELVLHEVKISKKLIDQEVKSWRKRLGEQTNHDDIAGEDVLTVKVVEMEGDAPKEGGIEKEVKMAVDLLKNKKLAKQLVSLKKGDSFDLNIFELEDNKPEFIKKQVLGIAPDTEINETFSATITEVERRSLGALSKDNFKNAFGQEAFDKYFENTSEPEVDDKGEPIVTPEEEKEVEASLRKKLEEDLKEYYKTSSERRMYKKAQIKLSEINDFSLPDEFLKKWLEQTNEKTSKEDIEKEYDNFTKDLKWNLLKNKISKDLGIEVSPDDVVQSFRDGILQYFGGYMEPERLDKLTQTVMEDKQAVERRYQEMVSNLLFPAIREKITVKEEKIGWEEFDELQKE